MSKEKCCGTCRSNRREKERKGINYWVVCYYCRNEQSSNYGSPTLYDDCCEDWESKDE